MAEFRDLVTPDPEPEPSTAPEPELEPVVEPDPAVEPIIEPELSIAPEPVVPEPEPEPEPEDEYYSDEEWAALSPEEQAETLKATEEEETTESPVVQKALKEINTLKENLLKSETEREQKFEDREKERDTLLRRRTSDLADAAKARGIDDLYRELKTEDKEQQKAAGQTFGQHYQEYQFVDPDNPPVDPKTRRPMTPAQVAALNKQANTRIQPLVEAIGGAIMAHPDMQGILPMVQREQSKARAKKDYDAWNETIEEVFKEKGLTVHAEPDENGQSKFSPEFSAMGSRVIKVGLFGNGAERSPEQRKNSVLQLLEMTPGAANAQGSITPTRRRKPPEGAGRSPRKRKRRPPPDVLAGSGQTASRAQGQTADNKRIMFSGIK